MRKLTQTERVRLQEKKIKEQRARIEKSMKQIDEIIKFKNIKRR